MKGNIVETNPGILWVKHDWLCKEFMSNIPEDIFFAIPNHEGYICIPKYKFDAIKASKNTYSQRISLLNKTVELNEKGKEQEKVGDIKGAIQTYEKCIALGYDAYFAYDRLLILYRKLKDYDNEERVVLKAMFMFKSGTLHEKYKKRFEKVKILKMKKI